MLGSTTDHPDISVVQLVNGIMADAQLLVKQQIALVRQEIKEELDRYKNAAALLAAAMSLASMGSLLLCFTLVYLLYWALPSWPLWVCFAVVGLPLTIAGSVLAWFAVKQLRQLDVKPDKSVDALKENLQWATNPK